MMKRIGLIDVDGTGRFPNLALMKISAWHKVQGDMVEWYDPWQEEYDVVYLSKVFSFSEDFSDAIHSKKVIRGGSGYCISLVEGKEVFDKTKDMDLPEEIEHIYPDYDLYPKLTKDTAYGFLTRGCPRGCSFCIVASKEGRCSRKVADLSEFWNGQKNIVLCDPNILACKDWKDLMDQLIRSKAVVDFNQGLDIRMMTQEKAEMLKLIKIKEIHFAWDRYYDKDVILPNLKMFADVCKGKINVHNSIVYVLTNYDTTIDQDLERIYTLRDMGYWAYVMIYDKEHSNKTNRDLARWCNNRFIFSKCPRFEDYKKKEQVIYNNQPSLF